MPPSRIHQTLGWKPVTSIRAGLERTLAFYRAHLEHYVTTESPVTTL